MQASPQTCIFCQIIHGTLPCFKVFESETHLAFLSIFPNTPGVTVVIPKTHYESYAFDLPETILHDLVSAAKTVGKLLDEKLGVGRTALVFEGMGVNHVHAKLFPLHGTQKKDWAPIHNQAEERPFFNTYPGYLTTYDGTLARQEDLELIVKKIREKI